MSKIIVRVSPALGYNYTTDLYAGCQESIKQVKVRNENFIDNFI